MEKENITNAKQKRKQGSKMLSEIENEAFEIYKEALEDKSYQEYYLYELAQKNEYLKSRITESLEVYNEGLREELVKERRRKLAMMLYAAASITVSLLTPAAISILVSTIYIIIGCKEIKRTLEKRKNAVLEKETLALFQRVQRLSTNIENNKTFITKKIKEISRSRVEESKTKPQEVNKILAANLIIQDYLNYDRLPENIDEEVKNRAINMLRQDLNTTNGDLEELLKEAKRKVSLDTLVKKMEFGEK